MLNFTSEMECGAQASLIITSSSLEICVCNAISLKFNHTCVVAYTALLTGYLQVCILSTLCYVTSV